MVDTKSQAEITNNAGICYCNGFVYTIWIGVLLEPRT